MEKKKPEIRFNGFEGEWETTTLGACSKKIITKNNGNEYNIVLTNSAERGIVDQRSYFDREIVNTENIQGYYIVSQDDFVYNPRISMQAPVGPINRSKIEYTGVMSPLYYVFRITDKRFNLTYLEWFFKSSSWHDFMYKNGNSGARSDRFSINDDVFLKLPIYHSKDISEQEKIGVFLTTLDKLIVKLEAKLDKLRKLKRALLEKMFTNVNRGGYETPEIRFKGYTDKWQVKELREVAKLRRGLTYSPGDICNDRKGIRVLRSSNISEDIFLLSEDDVFVKQSAVNIPYIHNYDILITAANGSSRLVGKHCIVADIQSDSCVPGGFMLCASTDSPFFLQASMSSSWYQTFVATYTLGGNGTIGNLSKTALEKQRFQIPSFSEQEQIGKCFTQIDTHFSKTSTKLTKLRNIKQSLLQKMFV